MSDRHIALNETLKAHQWLPSLLLTDTQYTRKVDAEWLLNIVRSFMLSRLLGLWNNDTTIPCRLHIGFSIKSIFSFSDTTVPSVLSTSSFFHISFPQPEPATSVLNDKDPAVLGRVCHIKCKYRQHQKVSMKKPVVRTSANRELMAKLMEFDGEMMQAAILNEQSTEKRKPTCQIKFSSWHEGF